MTVQSQIAVKSDSEGNEGRTTVPAVLISLMEGNRRRVDVTNRMLPEFRLLSPRNVRNDRPYDMIPRY